MSSTEDNTVMTVKEPNPDFEAKKAEIIEKKEAVIAELKEITPSTSNMVAKVKELRSRLYDCGSCGHEDNVRLLNDFNEVADALFNGRKEIWDGYVSQKEELIAEAEKLSERTDYKPAKEELKALLEKWKQVPRTSKEQDNVLWERFNAASNKLYDNARKDYEQKRHVLVEAKNKKEYIIAKAERLIFSPSLTAADDMKRLSEEFYAAGNAGKDNQALKEKFAFVKDRFYAARR